jgi:hypothetical protein
VVAPVDVRLINQLEIRLVNQAGRANESRVAVSGEVAMCDGSQLRIHRWEEPIERLAPRFPTSLKTAATSIAGSCLSTASKPFTGDRTGGAMSGVRARFRASSMNRDVPRVKREGIPGAEPQP